MKVCWGNSGVKNYWGLPRGVIHRVDEPINTTWALYHCRDSNLGEKLLKLSSDQEFFLQDQSQHEKHFLSPL